MNESVPGIQDRFDLETHEVRVGDCFVCERVSGDEWWFVDKYGWRIRALPKGTKVCVLKDQSHVEPRYRTVPPFSGTIVNRSGVSIVRESSAKLGGKWYHNDLKFWHRDLVAIISLPDTSKNTD